MTSQELARDKLKYWKLIDRANKVGFLIPSHWLKYGMPSNDVKEIISICMDAIPSDIFESSDLFDRYMKKT